MTNTTYLSLADARVYLGMAVGDATTDDVLIQDLLNAAAVYLETQTGMNFSAVTDTRYYDPLYDTDGRTLNLDRFLLTVTTLTNGDGTEIPATAYTLLPRNQTAKRAIQLLSYSGAGYGWTYSTNHEASISVEGTWGITTAAPEDVVQYMRRMVALLYHEKNSTRFETSAYVEGGRLILPQGMPPFAHSVIRSYRNYL